MADSRLQVVIDAVDRTKTAFDSVRSQVEEHKKQLRETGLLLSGIGAAGVLAFTKFAQAAIEERTSVQQLDRALRTVGSSYDANRQAIESVIAAQTQKTNFADEAQRQALQRLVTITGSYSASLASLPTVLDLAAASNMDLEQASVLVGKALTGQTEALRRYGIILKDNASPTETLAGLTAKFAGAAEAAANPLTILRNRVSELGERLGRTVLPVLEIALRVLSLLLAVLERIPTPVLKIIGVLGLAVTAFAALAGPMLLLISLIPQLIAGMSLLGTAFAVATGPIGLLVAALVAVGVAIAFFVRSAREAIGSAEEMDTPFDNAEAQAHALQERMVDLQGAMQNGGESINHVSDAAETLAPSFTTAAAAVGLSTAEINVRILEMSLQTGVAFDVMRQKMEDTARTLGMTLAEIVPKEPIFKDVPEQVEKTIGLFDRLSQLLKDMGITTLQLNFSEPIKRAVEEVTAFSNDITVAIQSIAIRTGQTFDQVETQLRTLAERYGQSVLDLAQSQLNFLEELAQQTQQVVVGAIQNASAAFRALADEIAAITGETQVTAGARLAARGPFGFPELTTANLLAIMNALRGTGVTLEELLSRLQLVPNLTVNIDGQTVASILGNQAVNEEQTRNK